MKKIIAIGEHIIDTLRANGVDARYVFRAGRANTGLSFVSLDAAGNFPFIEVLPPIFICCRTKSRPLCLRAPLFIQGAFVECPALPVPVADTTGAGGSFLRAFLYQLVRDGIGPEGRSGLTAEQLTGYLVFSARLRLRCRKKGP